MNRVISASEASKLSGKSASTIRRWARTGFIEAKKNGKGQFEYDEDSLRSYLATQPEHTQPITAHEEPDRLIDSLKDALRREQDALERERRLNDELRSEVKHHQRELLKLTYEMQAILKKESGNKLSRWIKDVVS